MPLASSIPFRVGGDRPLPAVIIDHVAAAIDRLPTQFKGKPNIEALLSIFTAPANDIEVMLWQLILWRLVDTAEGVTLDLIGKIVGQERAGLYDEDYRRFIKARITARRSKGLLETLYRVIRLVVNDSTMSIEAANQGPATIMFHLMGIAISDALADIVFGFLRDSVSSGVRVDVESATDDPNVTAWFEWDIDDAHGWDGGSFVDVRSNVR